MPGITITMQMLVRDRRNIHLLNAVSLVMPPQLKGGEMPKES